ncbi:MAG: tRNA lysidine(34) synthetase TilS [Cyanobacteria bacterium SIG26]|nr:tRNA lysidine(34) synthetase TilS [Cyanobacteria bacterium SIG26]
MIKIHKTIKSFLKKYDIDKSDLVYLVAFSGGFDSMCLLYALKKICKNKIVAIHLNHKWRAKESDLEELNCKNFCEHIGVEFYSENINPQIAKTETAAREARYKFFENCAQKFNSKIVFTAHNKNDNVETLVYRICTGTGISGLQGIANIRDIYYRPLLEINRDDIDAYCKSQNLIPNNDSSNNNIKYKRNLIRKNVIPLLQEIKPSALESISNLSEIAKEESQIIEEYLSLVISKISDENKINTQKFIKLSDALQNKIIYNIFIQYNLDYDRKKILKIKNFIHENSNTKSGKTCSLTNNLWIYTNEKIIEIISKKEQAQLYCQIKKEGKYEIGEYIFEIEKFEKPVRKFPDDEQNIAYVNLAKMPMPFELRTRQDGDIIKPLGSSGTQKLKKYLNAKKIPNHEKNNLLFLTQGNEILWAINLGISDKIKVTTHPTHQLKFYKK